MPIYDYKCNKCGHLSEELVRMGDSPALRCVGRNCDGIRERIIIAGPKVHMKDKDKADYNGPR